jgi:hypothetical protein
LCRIGKDSVLAVLGEQGDYFEVTFGDRHVFVEKLRCERVVSEVIDEIPGTVRLDRRTVVAHALVWEWSSKYAMACRLLIQPPVLVLAIFPGRLFLLAVNPYAALHQRTFGRNERDMSIVGLVAYSVIVAIHVPLAWVLVASSWAWQTLPVARPLALVVGIPAAILDGVLVLPFEQSMRPPWRVIRPSMWGTWPDSWLAYKQQGSSFANELQLTHTRY